MNILITNIPIANIHLYWQYVLSFIQQILCQKIVIIQIINIITDKHQPNINHWSILLSYFWSWFFFILLFGYIQYSVYLLLNYRLDLQYIFWSSQLPNSSFSLVIKYFLIFAVMNFNQATHFKSIVKFCNIKYTKNSSVENLQ